MNNTNNKRSGNKRNYKSPNKTKFQKEEVLPKDTEAGLTKGRDKYSAKPGHNDVSWYKRNPLIAEMAAKVPFATPIGKPLPSPTDLLSDTHKVNAPSIMGLCVIDFLPTLGVANTRSDAVNLAAQDLYSFVRHANSGSRNYERSDLMMYIAAAQSLYTGYFFLRRIFHLYTLTSYTNRFLPRDLIEAMGIDYDDFTNKAASYCVTLNTIGAQINTLAVPNHLTWFNRTAFMSQNIYADSENVRKASLYLFRPIGIYNWSGTTSTTGTSLRLRSWDVGNNFEDIPTTRRRACEYDIPTRSFGEYLIVLRNAVNAMLSDEDCGIISGDIIKAYNSNLFVVPTTELYESIAPIYNEDVLSQIENARAITSRDLLKFSGEYPTGTSETTVIDSLDVTQLTNVIHWNPMFVDRDAGVMSELALNSRKENPTPDDVMIMTRLHCTSEFTNQLPSGGLVERGTITTEDRVGYFSFVSLVSCGTELVTGFNYIYRVKESVGDQLVMYPTSSIMPLQIMAANHAYSNLTPLLAVSTLDWRPMSRIALVYQGETGYDEEGQEASGWLCEFDNFTSVPASTGIYDIVYNLNRIALMSELGIPSNNSGTM